MLLNKFISTNLCHFKRILIRTADFNYMIIDNAMAGNDFVDSSRVTLKQFEFTLLILICINKMFKNSL